jgi:hypothetical protein
VTQYVTGRDTRVEELLWLLNGQRPVAVDRIAFAVITGIYTPQPEESQDWPFRRGEIIPVLDGPVWNGHAWDDIETELLGKERDLKAWDMFHVRYSTTDVDDAIEVAALVEAGRDGFYEHFEGHWRRESDQDQAYRRWCSTLEPLRIGDYSWAR